MIFKILIVIISYFIGSISPSILLAKARGVNIKEEGSGNAGTTNALRVLGKKAGAVTFIIDILKGTSCAFLGSYFFDLNVGCLCGATVFLGHIFPIFYKFKGGKGAATAVGVMLGINWEIAIIALIIAAVFLFLSKRMSVGTLLAALAFPFLAWFMQPEIIYFAIFISIMIIIKHWANIMRIFKGEEPKMSIFTDSDK